MALVIKRLPFTLFLLCLTTLFLTGCNTTTAIPEPTPSPTETPVPAPTTPPTATPTLLPPTVTATSTPAGPSPGETRIDEQGVEQLWVPAGSFMMGSSKEDIDALNAQKPPVWVKAALPSEVPQHEVTLSNGYWIDKYEVTNAEFQKFVENDGYKKQEYWSDEGLAWLSKQKTDELPKTCTEDTQPNHPRVCVTWFEAQAYARWRGGKLPTEAEWEYVARGPEALVYPWGNTFETNNTNVIDSSGLTPVGSYPNGVSWVGAHDMSGNAMEWVLDWLDRKYYEQGEQVDPQGPEMGSRKVEKGGWWGSNPFVARAAYRHYEDTPDYQDHHIGFRVVSR